MKLPNTSFLKLAPIVSNASKALIVLTVALSSASTLAFDNQDRQAIEKNLEIMSQSIDNRDFSPVIDMMSPKIFTQFAKILDVSSTDIKQMLTVQSNAILASEDNEMSYFADFDNAKFLQTKTGRDYVLIPTKMQMITEDTGVAITGTLLALKDENTWYMMRIDNDMHLDVLNKAYPDMQDIEIFEPTMETFEP